MENANTQKRRGEKMTNHINEMILRIEKRRKWIEYMDLLDQLREKHEIKVKEVKRDGEV